MIGAHLTKLIIDLIEIALLGWSFYFLYNLVRRTRTYRIFNGVLSLLVIWQVADWMELEATLAIFRSVDLVEVGIVALAILFMPELRRGLAKLNLRSFYRSHKHESDENIAEIVNACARMAESRTGALIAIERDDSLDEWLSTGVRQDSELTESLLESIFYKGAPLHDGAVLVRGNRIIGAKIILPLPIELTYEKQRYGLRHRAAIGLTEQCDALCVIVSEETGSISVAENGKLAMRVARKKLLDVLQEKLLPGRREHVPFALSFIRWLRQLNYRRMFTHDLMAKGLACFGAIWIWGIQSQFVNPVVFDLVYDPPREAWIEDARDWYAVRDPKQLSNYQVSLESSNFQLYGMALATLVWGKPEVRVVLEQGARIPELAWANSYWENVKLKPARFENPLETERVERKKLDEIEFVGTLAHPNLGEAIVTLDTGPVLYFGPRSRILQVTADKAQTTEPVDITGQIEPFEKEGLTLNIPDGIAYWNPDLRDRPVDVLVTFTGKLESNYKSPDMERAKAAKQQIFQDLQSQEAVADINEYYERQIEGLEGRALTLSDDIDAERRKREYAQKMASLKTERKERLERIEKEIDNSQSEPEVQEVWRKVLEETKHWCQRHETNIKAHVKGHDRYMKELFDENKYPNPERQEKNEAVAKRIACEREMAEYRQKLIRQEVELNNFRRQRIYQSVEALESELKGIAIDPRSKPLEQFMKLDLVREGSNSLDPKAWPKWIQYESHLRDQAAIQAQQGRVHKELEVSLEKLVGESVKYLGPLSLADVRQRIEDEIPTADPLALVVAQRYLTEAESLELKEQHIKNLIEMAEYHSQVELLEVQIATKKAADFARKITLKYGLGADFNVKEFLKDLGNHAWRAQPTLPFTLAQLDTQRKKFGDVKALEDRIKALETEGKSPWEIRFEKEHLEVRVLKRNKKLQEILRNLIIYHYVRTEIDQAIAAATGNVTSVSRSPRRSS
jgi:uncharacterized protein (TIGR00159 family)